MTTGQHTDLTARGQPVSGGTGGTGAARRPRSEEQLRSALRGRAAAPAIGSLYIHVPFCVHKCHYCDFYSFVDTRDQQSAFVDRLITELRVLAMHARRGNRAEGERVPLGTIFVGGGTPSLLRVDLWERLLKTLHAEFDLSRMGSRDKGEVSSENSERGTGEFTVECNPESTSSELMHVLRAGGVNRVSIGAQSFVPRHLKTLERMHNPENVARALGLARDAGIDRQSIDLIFGIPGQTVAEWVSDVERGLSLKTTHISCYNLTYEPNTAMTKRLELGEFEPLDEDVEAEMYEATLGMLRGAGMERYEVSNYAIPGDESRHNLAYWRQEQWMAAGPSASGHAWAGETMRAGSWRWKNSPRLGDYLASDAAIGYSPVVDIESPDPLRLVRERIMMGLRLREGLDRGSVLADLEALSSASSERLRKAIAKQVDIGYLLVADQRWTLTDRGMMFCDGIAGELMRCV